METTIINIYRCSSVACDSWHSSIFISREFFIHFHLINDIANIDSSTKGNKAVLCHTHDNNIFMLANSKIV